MKISIENNIVVYVELEGIENSVVIPDDAIGIDQDAFENCHQCENVRKIHIGKNISKIIPGAFRRCPRIDEITVSEENHSYMVVENCLLTKDGKTLILGCYNSTIPEGVECIEKFAFAGSDIIGSRLEKIVMPSSLISIGEEAFSYSKCLKQVVFNEGLRDIGDLAFANSDALESITLPKGLKTLGAGAFILCTRLESVEIQSTELKAIRGDTFECCISLRSIVILEGTESIGNLAFNCCKKLEEVVLPKSLNCIGSVAFARSDALESVTLPKGLKTIGKRAFCDCKKLESVEIQSTELKAISSGAFSGCTSLKSIVIPEGTESIADRAFEGCDKLEEVVLPKSIYGIGHKAFGGCTSLKQINIPHCAGIGMEAFDTGTVINIV